MAFKLRNHKRNFKVKSYGSREEAAPGIPLIRKKLGKGIEGEANNDGSIFVSENIVPGSTQENELLMHEVKHITDMQIGKLGYTDDTISWNGNTYPRADGKIYYEGEWQDEGTPSFPWEDHYRTKT